MNMFSDISILWETKAYFVFHEGARQHTFSVLNQLIFVHDIDPIVCAVVFTEEMPTVTQRQSLNREPSPGWLAPHLSEDASLHTLCHVVVMGWLTRTVGLVQLLMSYCLMEQNDTIIKKRFPFYFLAY